MNVHKLMLMTIGYIYIGMSIGVSSSLASSIDPSIKTCRVTDPTDTPLNVRLSPKGKIISTISNQTIVYPQSISFDETNKPWMLISIKQQGKDKILGWVVREFVSCYQ